MNFQRIILNRAMLLSKTDKRDAASVNATSFAYAIEKTKESIDLQTMGGRVKAQTLEVLDDFKNTDEVEKWSSAYSGIEIRKNPFNLVRIDHPGVEGRIISIDIASFDKVQVREDPVVHLLNRISGLLW